MEYKCNMAKCAKKDNCYRYQLVDDLYVKAIIPVDIDHCGFYFPTNGKILLQRNIIKKREKYDRI